MGINKLLIKLGLSWHDIFVVIVLFETCWWGMFAFMDSADVVIRAVDEATRTEYHVYVLVQKCASFLKLGSALICFWYGTLHAGKGIYPRIYLLFGIFIDVLLTLSWIMISTEEAWPLSPVNIFGIHYILTFVLLRFMIYSVLYAFIREIFVSPFGPPVVGTVNGTVMGIPEQGNCRSVNCGSNLGFFGKGVKATLEYYRQEIEQCFLVAVIWDVLWNWSIIFSQELPEVAFNYVFVGLFGSVALNIPTDDLILRLLRVALGFVAVFLVMKKNHVYMKLWIVLYTIIMVINIGFLCYIAASALIDETTMGSIILCVVFFASNMAKLFVIYCSLRYYVYLSRANACLVQENNNDG